MDFNKSVLVLLYLISVNVIGYFAFPAYNQRNIGWNENWENNEEIQIFREYLRIPTVHPNVDYKPAVAFLERQAASLNLPTSIYYPVDDQNPVVVMTLRGTDPSLPSIMLNSHMDVVPVYEEFWTHPPFAAEIDENGDIFARGTQDMKCVGMQYLAAIRALKRQGVVQFKRTIYFVFVPDEELGGKRGMDGFIKTETFNSMNVGLMMDEGGSTFNDDGSLSVYYGERTLFQTEFIFHGQSGHGSKLFNNTPGEKLNYVVGKFMEMRKEEARKLNELKYPYGNVTSINLTILEGGVKSNVIPAEMKAFFDIRLSINIDIDEFKQQIIRWCDQAGGNITIHHLNDGEKEKLTVVGDLNPYWVALESAFSDVGIKVVPNILPATTDSRYIRRLNIPAFGITPLLNTTPKQHDHNEYINAETFLTGIELYEKIIPKLASV